ncbi:alpha/beta fold hydrolase [Bradyrhizobium liaoningense]|uniref:alpha/beta fold hydrolase n=1 Tax=Bradyrhizobium liaoningense TaxID=43992 RepID=UPI001BABABA0|nr:alpha/beta hydrolase [Bradyrhizobium liaoningense]MBR0859158.1 alpha/beta hydrolase [Bradyrhizobium liaoningense]
MNPFSITHRRIHANGIDLHCAESGEAGAPLLVLLHGFPEFWFTWRDYMSALAASGFHVVAPDQRGYNLSDKPRGADAYGLDTLADDIAALAGVLGHETFRVVGHDWGGSVAWSLAARQGARLSRVAVLNAAHPAVWIDAMGSDPEQRRRSGYVRFLRLPWLPEALLRLGRYDGLRRAFATARPDAFPPDVLQAYQEAWRQPGALTAMLNWYRALLRQRAAAPARGTLAPPCLILWGDDDPFAIPTLADDSAALCREAEVVQMSGVGHWIIHDTHEAVLARLRGFLT